jgi:putative hydrolase of the HAD superfamily
MPQSSAPYDVLLFDLGGVLVELAGVQRMLDLAEGRFDEAQLWHTWLHSPAVRAFETGSCDAQAFAEAVVEEFSLCVSPEQLLAEFVPWAKQAYPGTAEILSELRGAYTLVSLSNTNPLHWNRIRDEMGFLHLFDQHFPSHETGRMKPDLEAFTVLLPALGCPPERIVFFDDNQLNVDAAQATGMAAYRVRGTTGLRAQLVALGLLEG